MMLRRRHAKNLLVPGRQVATYIHSVQSFTGPGMHLLFVSVKERAHGALALACLPTAERAG